MVCTCFVRWRNLFVQEVILFAFVTLSHFYVDRISKKILESRLFVHFDVCLAQCVYYCYTGLPVRFML